MSEYVLKINKENKNINKLVIVELTPTKFKILVINKSSIKKIV